MPNARRKGSQGEREAGKLLADHGWTETHRQLGQARDGGCDLRPLSPAGVRYSVEVKRRKVLPQLVTGALEQARVGHCGVPVALVRGDNGEWVVCQYLNDWLKTS